MELIVSVLIAGVIITFIAMPLFSSSHKQEDDEPTALETLGSQRDAAYEALRDLDLDFQTGKLSEVDYNTLRDKYKSRAAVILQQIDAWQVQDAALEQQIAQRRTAKPAPASDADDLEREIAKRRNKQADTLKCKNCGTPHQAGDQFCAKCGKKL